MKVVISMSAEKCIQIEYKKYLLSMIGLDIDSKIDTKVLSFNEFVQTWKETNGGDCG